MANEITISKVVRLNNGTLQDTRSTGNLQITQSTALMYSNVQVIGTSEENIAVGADIATLGIATIKNLDSTNYIQWGPSSGGSMVAGIRLKAGEEFTFRMEPGTTYRAKANTAACNLLVVIYND